MKSAQINKHGSSQAIDINNSTLNRQSLPVKLVAIKTAYVMLSIISVGLLKDLKDGKITRSIYFHFFAVNYEKH